MRRHAGVEGGRRGPRRRAAIRVPGVALGLVIFLAPRAARAEETSCQSLANWYAANPTQLEAESLAALRACVDQSAASRVRNESSGTRRGDGQRRPWGSWPTAPAWSDGWIEPVLWGDD